MTLRKPTITNRDLLQETAELIAEGMTERQIARRLQLSPSGVHSRAMSLLAYLGERNRAHAVALAYQTGLLTLRTNDTVTPVDPTGQGGQ